MVSECKPEWNREAITVFSKLPSLRRLQATPLLQTSLLFVTYVGIERAEMQVRTQKFIAYLTES